MATVDKDKIFSAEAIRDTAVHNSVLAITAEFNAETIVVYNDLNETVAIQLQGSLDETNWIDISDPFNVASNIKDYATVTDYFPFYRVTAKCTTAPTTGDINVWILKASAVN